jgi:hypothetical protein
MQHVLFTARQMSLALLIVAVVDHGAVPSDLSGASPNTSGLVRLGRDLVRCTNRKKSIIQNNIESSSTPQPVNTKLKPISLSNLR